MAAILSELIERTVPPMGYELVDWETTPKGRLVRVFIDKPGGVDVEDCARVSNQLTRLFAVEHIDFDRLEVSSPGLDRPLRTPRDWARRVGEFVRIHLSEAVEGKRTWIGKLLRSGDESAVIVADRTGQEIEIPYRAVQLARVDVRFEE